ncbi:cytochrome c-type biogenesis protein CcmH [Saezia sanguinis]|uniref:cytochrome c-type biogenesis protein CcmH n=1 Tax=Saezia sanguinis TaxID=1965230 RepID=UPI003029BC41
MRRWLVFLLTAFCVGSGLGNIAHAAVDTHEFKSAQQEKTYNELVAELRCPQCQNNNIAESNAPLSNDMRDKVYELLQQDYSKQQVVDYMVARYGNFITYAPPVTPVTVVLWLGPLCVLLIGVAFLVYRSRHVPAAMPAGSAADDAADGAADEDLPQPVERGGSAAVLNSRPLAPAFWLLSGVFLLLLTVGIYYKTGGWQQVRYQASVAQALPDLKARAVNINERLSVQDMEQLAFGLRDELTKTPDDVSNWMLLGDVYLGLNRYGEALQAMSRAYTLRPDDFVIKSIYGQLLVRSNDPADTAFGEKLLREVLQQNRTDTYAISALAFYAYSQNRYQEAIRMWEYLLQILPKDNPRISVIQQSIDQAKRDYDAQQGK